jgi:PadR family transcriptional regulator PadR
MSKDSATTSHPRQGWLRAVLELLLFASMGDGPRYGYDVAQQLERLGLGTLKGSQLYPALNQLEDAGLVSTEWRPGVGGPGRKFYRLTDAGWSAFAQQAAAWHEFAAAVDELVESASEQQPGAGRATAGQEPKGG